MQTWTIIPANAILLYKMYTQRNTDWTQYDVREKFDNWWHSINLIDMNPYKKRCEHINKEVPISKRQDNKESSANMTLKAVSPNGKPYLEEDSLDKVFRIYLAICILYYMADTILKIYEFSLNPADLTDKCKVGFFIHHLFTIVGFKAIFLADHFPWFLAGPMAYHTVVVGIPSLGLINNVIYVLLVLVWLYKMTTKPFWSRRVYRMLFYSASFLMVPLAFLAYGNCI